MTEQTLRVNLGERSYDIVVTGNSLHQLGAFARQRSDGDKALIVTHEIIRDHAEIARQSLHDAGFCSWLAFRSTGEREKCLESASSIYDILMEIGADRRTLVVAVGGGVIGDLAGFVAATFSRGIPLLMVPTTLLAMVDSSVGGKVGVNHSRAKNMIGAFYQPIGVFIDVATLNTLPDREFRSGLAEVVKYGVILDADFFAYLEKNVDAILKRDPASIQRIVLRSCELKAQIVAQDEREETDIRAKLNYGHTFAHAFEIAGGYAEWLHGEAVAAGMVCASRLAQRRGLIPSEISERQVRLLQAFSLPTAPKQWPVEDLLRTMRRDKKAVAGQMRFILPIGVGEVALVDDVPESDVRATLESVMR
ncbi:MAG: 3-dehydroquinate synthase [Planctomycetes bacterium]|nr:3-dehydroquinate synthase [Planctomycetota bacterium]